MAVNPPGPPGYKPNVMTFDPTMNRPNVMKVDPSAAFKPNVMTIDPAYKPNVMTNGPGYVPPPPAAPGGFIQDASMPTAYSSQAPNIPPFQGPPPVGYNPTTGKAPTPTPYGDFTAPDPSKIADDPAYQWRLSQGTKALERGAAARGTLLTGGTAKALQDYGQGAASQEYGNIYDRALSGYNTNRATNQQNFGQNLSAFQGNLARDQFGHDVATAEYDRKYAAGRDAYSDNAANIREQTDVFNTNADRQASAYQNQLAEYERNIAQQRAQQAAIDAARPPLIPKRLPNPLDLKSGWRG